MFNQFGIGGQGQGQAGAPVTQENLQGSTTSLMGLPQGLGGIRRSQGVSDLAKRSGLVGASGGKEGCQRSGSESCLDAPVPKEIWEAVTSIGQDVTKQKRILLENQLLLDARKEADDAIAEVKREIAIGKQRLHELEMDRQREENRIKNLNADMKKAEKMIDMIASLKSANPALTKDVTVQVMTDICKDFYERLNFIEMQLSDAEQVIQNRTEPPITTPDVVQALDTSKDLITYLSASLQQLTEDCKKVAAQIYGEHEAAKLIDF